MEIVFVFRVTPESEGADVASGLEVRELLHDVSGVGLEFRSFVESGLKGLAEWVLGVHHEVSDPGSHDEFSDRDLVAGAPLFLVMIQVPLHHLVEELRNRDEGLCILLLL